MKIKFDKEKNSLTIKDDLKMQLRILKFIFVLNFVLNLVSALLNIYKNYNAGIENEVNWLQLILGIGSVGALFFLSTRSTKEVIPVNEISFLFKKAYFGSDRYFLKLKNGKTRNLPLIKHQPDVLELERILEESGIRIKSGK
jgi:hypothetical protein